MSENKQESRKIVFVNQATGYLIIDIINSFAAHFEKVALITGSVRVQDVPLNSAVRLSKIIKYNRGAPIKKLASWITGTMQIFFLLLLKYRGYEIFYVTVPPTAYLLSLVLRNRFSILVYDIYPDALKALGIKETNFISHLWEKWNRKLFSRAHRIFTLGEAMKKALTKYVRDDKILVINNWSGLTMIRPVMKCNNSFIKKLNLEDKFIVEYSGNIGHTHNVETLIEIAKEFKDEHDVVFLFIGRGNRSKTIQHLIAAYDLHNCILLPFQPDSEITQSLSAADLSVVVLDEKMALCSIPSKTYNIMAVGSPFLVIGSNEAELAELIKQHELGRSYMQDEIQRMAGFIRDLKQHPSLLNHYRNNSLKAASNFTYYNAKQYLEQYLD